VPDGAATASVVGAIIGATTPGSNAWDKDNLSGKLTIGPIIPAVRAQVGDADGILEVRGRGRDWIEIAVWNTDGSLAEMSGNGTRIAAAWLISCTGSTLARVHVGSRCSCVAAKSAMIGTCAGMRI